MRHALLIASLLLAASLPACDIRAEPIGFERLAGTGDSAPPREGTLDPIVLASPDAGTVSIGDDGAVAFGTTNGLFFFDGSLRTIEYENGVGSFFGVLSTSTAGRRVASLVGVAGGFPILTFFGERIWLYNSEMKSLPLAEFMVLGDPSLAPDGRVAFRIELAPTAIDEYPIEIWQWDGGDPVTLVSGDLEQGESFGDPTWNASGQLAFTRLMGGFRDIVRIEPDGALTVVADEAEAGCKPAVRCWLGTIEMDGAGSIVFTTQYLDSEAVPTSRLLRADGEEAPVLLADSSGLIDSFEKVRMSDTGLLVVEAVLDDGRTALFLGSEIAAGPFVATGDSLFGSEIVSLSLGGIDGNGRVAFQASLADQSSVVVRTIPEPDGGGALSLLTLTGMALSRHVSRCLA